MLDWRSALGIVAIGLCLGGIFLCSLAEAAMLGITETGLRRLQESREAPARRVARLLDQGSYLSALIVGVNVFVIILSTVMTLQVHQHLGDGSGAGYAREAWHLGMVLFILVFAELTPKTYGGLYPERVALRVSRPVALLTRLMRPVVALLAGLSQPLLGHGPAARRQGQLVTVAELRMAADVSEEEGMVEPAEAEMLDNVMDLGETQARQVMVPRVAVVAAEEEATVADFAAIAGRTGLSRIPIYRETLDNVTGIVYVKDVLRRIGEQPAHFTLREIARPPLYFPETKRIDDLLRELREQRIHIGIVVDEFGGTAGIVTIEDILEELVGDIRDEHDQPAEDIVRVSDKELLVDGRVRIAEVNELLDIALPEEQHDTVGGLVSGVAGRIPVTGETFRVQGVQLVVEAGDGQHVGKVRVVVGTREGGDG
jgi:putative hemolysin